jgi:hypothetical protein
MSKKLRKQVLGEATTVVRRVTSVPQRELAESIGIDISNCTIENAKPVIANRLRDEAWELVERNRIVPGLKCLCDGVPCIVQKIGSTARGWGNPGAIVVVRKLTERPWTGHVRPSRLTEFDYSHPVSVEPRTAAP